MAWWNRGSTRSPAWVTLPTWQGVTAAAQPFDITNKDDQRKLATLQQQWQTDAWLYLDRIGELKDAYRFVENSFRRLSVFAAYARAQDEEPVPVRDATERPDSADDDDDEAADLIPADVAELADAIVSDFSARDGGQSSLLARLGGNIFMVGEALVIQRSVLARRPGAGERPEDVERAWDWEVRSIHEIRQAQGNQGIETVDAPDQQRGTPVEGIDGVPAFVERVFRPHPQFANWADSNVKAAIDTLEEMRLLGLVARASLRSRAMAGFFKIPEELDFSATDLPAGAPGPTTQGVTFERAMAEAFAAAIGNEADPNSVAPVLVRGKSEFLHGDVFGPVQMPRRYSEDERAQYEQAVQKLARTIELPMEAITGASNLNHWNIWAIDQEKYQAYIEPLAQIVAEALTYGLLRPRLRDEGVDEAVIDRMVVAVDASRLIRRGDIGKVAEQLHEKQAISDEALRRANVFGDDDAPSDEELVRRWLFRSVATPEMMPALLRAAGLHVEMPRPMALPAGIPLGDEPGGDHPEDEPMPGPPVNDEPEGVAAHAAALTAALAASRDVGRALASIDAVLLERLLTACDQSVNRVLERVGARIRSKPRSSQPSELRTALSVSKDVPNTRLAQHLDSALVAAAIGPDPVTTDDFTDLQARFDAWVAAAQDASLRELAAATEGAAPEDTVRRAREQQTEDRSEAWGVLAASLVAYTLALLAGGEDVLDEGGEWDPTITVRPSVIRQSLAVAGGSTVERVGMGGVASATDGPLGGVATGDTMRRALSEAGWMLDDWEWEYGSAPRQRPFEPHLRLDGAPMSEWGEYRPADHSHCRCQSVPRLSPPSTRSAAAA